MATNRSQVRNNTEVLYKVQGGNCFYCNTGMFLRKDVGKKFARKNRNNRATFDHIIVKSNGGTYALTNGVCACFKCNNMRGKIPQQVFIDNFDVIELEWDSRCIAKAERRKLHRAKHVTKKVKEAELRERRAVNKAKNCYLVARFAIQIGKTVEDLFLEFVYNNTYELVRDL